MRSHKQAESEDCDQVDIEHFEKILPQLVRSSIKFVLILYLEAIYSDQLMQKNSPFC